MVRLRITTDVNNGISRDDGINVSSFKNGNSDCVVMDGAELSRLVNE